MTSIYAEYTIHKLFSMLLRNYILAFVKQQNEMNRFLFLLIMAFIFVWFVDNINGYW